VTQFDVLAAAAGAAGAEPWPVPALVIEARRSPAATASTIRDAVKPLLAAARGRSPAGGHFDAQTDDRSGNPRTTPDGPRTLAGPRPGGHGEPGRLIVLEGIDHAGRSTHAGLLERYLRYAGRGVVRTSFGTSLIAGEVLREAKRDRGWDPAAMLLLYAADLAERLQHVIGPALRAGLTVIADRYAYTPAARAVVRGLAPAWVEGLFAFAPPPDAVLLLELPPSLAVARGRADRRADRGADGPLLDSGQAGDYERFQGQVASWFADGVERFAFQRVNADRDAQAVQASIRRSVGPLLDLYARDTATS
jgi:dTMP kinase